MWTNDGKNIYHGDCLTGDRAATDAEILAWESASAAVARNAEICAQLAYIDSKSVRPMVDGDAAYLVVLRAPVAALRAELKSLQER